MTNREKREQERAVKRTNVNQAGRLIKHATPEEVRRGIENARRSVLVRGAGEINKNRPG